MPRTKETSWRLTNPWFSQHISNNKSGEASGRKKIKTGQRKKNVIINNIIVSAVTIDRIIDLGFDHFLIWGVM